MASLNDQLCYYCISVRELKTGGLSWVARLHCLLLLAIGTFKCCVLSIDKLKNNNFKQCSVETNRVFNVVTHLHRVSLCKELHAYDHKHAYACMHVLCISYYSYYKIMRLIHFKIEVWCDRFLFRMDPCATGAPAVRDALLRDKVLLETSATPPPPLDKFVAQHGTSHIEIHKFTQSYKF